MYSHLSAIVSRVNSCCLPLSEDLSRLDVKCLRVCNYCEANKMLSSAWELENCISMSPSFNGINEQVLHQYLEIPS